MAQSIDLNGMIITIDGERHPCKLLAMSEKGFLELSSLDQLSVGTKAQLVINNPNIRTNLTITSAETFNEGWLCEAVPEEPIANIQAKIVEHKVRTLKP